MATAKATARRRRGRPPKVRTPEPEIQSETAQEPTPAPAQEPAPAPAQEPTPAPAQEPAPAPAIDDPWAAEKALRAEADRLLATDPPPPDTMRAELALADEYARITRKVRSLGPLTANTIRGPVYTATALLALWLEVDLVHFEVETFYVGDEQPRIVPFPQAMARNIAEAMVAFGPELPLAHPGLVAVGSGLTAIATVGIALMQKKGILPNGQT